MTPASYVSVLYCRVCGEEIERAEKSEGSALEPDWSAWKEVDKKTHQRVSKHDSSIVETAEHNWDDGLVIAPTCCEEGKTIYTCKSCGYYEEREIVEPDPSAHVLGPSVQEKRVNATTKSSGSYYLVKRCTVCGEVINRTHVEILKLKKGEYNIDIRTKVKGGKKYTGKSYNLDVNSAPVSSNTITVEAVFEEIELPYKGEVSMTVDDTYELGYEIYPSGTMPRGMRWSNSDSDVVTVDGNGVITAVNAKTVTVPAAVKIGGKTFSVTKISAKAFKGSKATKLIVKTKKLTKKSVKGSLKGSKIKTVQVKVGKKSVNKKYVKKYKKFFTKKNAGRTVTVK